MLPASVVENALDILIQKTPSHKQPLLHTLKEQFQSKKITVVEVESTLMKLCGAELKQYMNKLVSARSAEKTLVVTMPDLFAAVKEKVVGHEKDLIDTMKQQYDDQKITRFMVEDLIVELCGHNKVISDAIATVKNRKKKLQEVVREALRYTPEKKKEGHKHKTIQTDIIMAVTSEIVDDSMWEQVVTFLKGSHRVRTFQDKEDFFSQFRRLIGNETYKTVIEKSAHVQNNWEEVVKMQEVEQQLEANRKQNEAKKLQVIASSSPFVTCQAQGQTAQVIMAAVLKEQQQRKDECAALRQEIEALKTLMAQKTTGVKRKREEDETGAVTGLIGLSGHH